MFWSLVLEIRKHALSWITICMIYHRSCIDTRFEKQKPWHHEQANIFMHYTSSTIVSSEGINLQKPSWDFSNWGSSSKTYISSKPSSVVPIKPSFVLPTKPSFVLVHQAHFCLAHQAQFRIGPPSPVLFGPPSLVLFGPPSPVSYWPIKPSFILAHQA